MIEYRWEQSLSPGNEQAVLLGLGRRRRSTAPATTWASKSKAVDAMIAAMLAAPTSATDFVAAMRALDRVLMSGFYVVPLYYPARAMGRALDRESRIPPQTSLFGYLPETWWQRDDSQMIRDPRRRRSDGEPPRRSTTCSAAPACAVPTRSR